MKSISQKLILPILCATLLFATLPANANEVKLNDTWSYISTGNHDEDKYLESLFFFLHGELKSIFGAEVVNGIKCTIYIDRNAPGPFIQYVSNEELRIRLNVRDTNLWSQLVWQLAHEMTHYIFCQTYDFVKLKGSKWNEEIVADAMALYMLKQLADNWDDFVLSKYDRYRDTPYSSAIYERIDNELRRAAGRVLKSSQEAITIQQFAELNRTVNFDRENHMAEVNFLFALLITLEKEQIKPSILEMYQYLVDDTYIDYERWMHNAKYPDVIGELSRIQPEIIKPTSL